MFSNDPESRSFPGFKTMYRSASALATPRDLESVISQEPSHFQDKQSQKRADCFFPFGSNRAISRGGVNIFSLGKQPDRQQL
jgi:hypothetical protein